jgi:hypothetical protein
VRWLLLVIAISVQQVPDRDTPRNGPYENKEGHRCWKHPDQVFNGLTFHQCPCEMRCDEHGDRREDYSCVTACNKGQQCVCHADETCEAPQ